ncbi:calcium-binding protein [Herbaspirillum sp. alder98]|uniref:calcium-binding protein n=1 Tax=Herbaspirillum sp. alder98 TaxID=2913096 RepID=UPI001CD8EC40|nr:calcium-binding protein [Herbaspirillum sp. alder98]MCA1323196.1 hypothetical protein [Herbaspirillum sp. alder98]
MIQPPIQPSANEPDSGTADDARVLIGTDNNDLLLGGPDGDVIAGVAGNDALYGGQGNDDLDGGVGNDELHGQGGNDVLCGGPGDDFLSGDAGNNVLRGGAGADIYVVGNWQGHDVIDNAAGGAVSGEGDMILFAKGVVPGMVFVQRDDDDLTIEVPVMHASARVLDYFSGDGGTPHAIDQFRFDDATTWTAATVKERVLNGSSRGERLIGYASADWIEGRGGDDVIEGRGGNDLLYGGEGNDVLDGGAGHDALYGGAGNDRLVGGAGSDYYFFGRGSGHDVIVSDGNTAGDADCVHFGQGIDENQLWFRRIGDDLAISIIGATDSLEVKNWFAGAAAGFTTLILASEKSIAPDKIDALVAAMASMPLPSSTASQALAQDHGQLTTLIASSWLGGQAAA